MIIKGEITVEGYKDDATDQSKEISRVFRERGVTKLTIGGQVFFVNIVSFANFIGDHGELAYSVSFVGVGQSISGVE